jgi:hypothetical protein
MVGETTSCLLPNRTLFHADMSNVPILRQHSGLALIRGPRSRQAVLSDVVSQVAMSIEKRYNLRERTKTSKCHSMYQITTTSKEKRRSAKCTRERNPAKTKPHSDGKQSETITGTKDEDGSECSRSTERFPTEELQDTVKKIVADYHANYKPWQERMRKRENPFPWQKRVR